MTTEDPYGIQSMPDGGKFSVYGCFHLDEIKTNTSGQLLMDGIFLSARMYIQYWTTVIHFEFFEGSLIVDATTKNPYQLI